MRGVKLNLIYPYLNTTKSHEVPMKINDEIFISRKLANNYDNFKLFDEELKKDISKATRIKIVSGYFGKDYIIELLGEIKRKNRASCHVTLIFGYENTTELIYGQIDVSDIKKSIASLGYGKKKIQIKLFRDKAPLHTKIYGLLLGTQHVWYVGSANLSRAIEGGRHELMVKIRGKSNALDSYVGELLHTNPTPISCDENFERIGIQKILSSGCMLFKPSRYKRFTHDAFIIDKEDRRKISNQLGQSTNVPHSDPSAEGFGFNLLSALGLTESETPEKRQTNQTRRLCIETIYGYWVPNAYANNIRQMMSKIEMDEIKKLHQIRDRLKETPDEALKNIFHTYTNASMEYFRRIGVNIKKNKEADKLFEGFVQIRRKWLDDNDWIKRSASKLFIEKMPDIWEDFHAADSFISSFCEDVALVLNSPGKKGMIYKNIHKGLSLPPNPTADLVRERLGSVKKSFW